MGLLRFSLFEAVGNSVKYSIRTLLFIFYVVGVVFTDFLDDAVAEEFGALGRDVHFICQFEVGAALFDKGECLFVVGERLRVR